MKKRINIKEKFRAFREWQKAPHVVAPNAEGEHECANCHDHYKGKFCPRCGQPAKVGRYSFKTVMAQFFEEAGMGERGMFRTIMELILRPGYLIRDYLNGMQASYFGPFKMFFLLAAISIFVTHGLNIKMKNFSKDAETEVETQEIVTAESDTVTVKTSGDEVEDVVSFFEDKEAAVERTKEIFHAVLDTFDRFQSKYPEIFNLLFLLFESFFLFLFFRHSPNIPDLRFSELFVALIYIVNMMAVYNILFNFFCLNKLTSYTFILALIPLKQLFGYSLLRITLKSIAAFVIMFALLLLFLVASVFITVLLVNWLG